MTREQDREALRRKIEAAEARFSDQTPEQVVRENTSGALAYAKQNPGKVLSAAALLGLTLGILSRRGRKTVTISGLAGRIATEAAIGFALAMYQKSRERAEAKNAEQSPLAITDESARD